MGQWLVEALVKRRPATGRKTLPLSMASFLQLDNSVSSRGIYSHHFQQAGWTWLQRQKQRPGGRGYNDWSRGRVDVVTTTEAEAGWTWLQLLKQRPGGRGYNYWSRGRVDVVTTTLQQLFLDVLVFHPGHGRLGNVIHSSHMRERWQSPV